jgi:ribonuclease HI
VLLDKEDNILVDEGVYLGITTNNQAEYTALKLGLERALKDGARELDVYMDSLLVVNQMKGIFKVKNRDLWPIHDSIKQMVPKFKKISFGHVPRELNKLADAAVNRALDDQMSK